MKTADQTSSQRVPVLAGDRSARPADLSEVCRVIATTDGDPLLRFMRDVYTAGGSRPKDQLPAMRLAAELALVEASDDRVRLTDLGYLVGNVAKEYCNWIDHGRRMPPPRPNDAMVAGKDVLDLGCSFGRWLWEFQPLARSVVGVESQQAYIDLGGALARREGIPAPRLICGSAEELHRLVPELSCDFVFSRLVFNHVRIRPTLGHVVRTLRPGGTVWFQVERIKTPIDALLSGERRLRTRAFAAFGVANTLLCMATGRQAAVRMPGRMHSVHSPAYPTLGWWRRTLAAAGLRDFRVEEMSRYGATFSARRV
jgi:SAM-dependent methyltransferase